jgi:alanine racemase
VPIEARLAAAGLPPLARTAWLEIDADALIVNLGAIREAVGEGVRVEPAVKADAYGHGAVPVAEILEAAGADGFSVAAFDEAVELRAGGIKAPILVLYPVPAEYAAEAARLGVALTVGDERLLRRLLDHVATDGGVAAARTADAQPLLVQLEVETGLGRGGLDPGRVVWAARRLRRTPGIRLEGAWSHLAAPDDGPRTRAQGERLERAVAALVEAGIEVPIRHLSASGGLLAAVPPLEAVRPGLAIYGLVPDGFAPSHSARGLAAALRPVMSLRARPVRVVELPRGWGVSYGPTFETRRPSRIATLPLGYGDGWSRSLSNRADALVRGVRVPLVGTVAMDAVMADVTDVPGAPVSVDEEFTLLGEQDGERIDAAELARSRNTISWEVVTAMSRRLPRVYHAAAGPLGMRTLGEGEDRWLRSSSGATPSGTSRSTRS